MGRRKNFERTIFNGIEAILKNPIERGLFPLTDDQKDDFISHSMIGLNQAIHNAIIRYDYRTPLMQLDMGESQVIEYHSRKITEFMANLDKSEYTTDLNALITSFVIDLSNLFADDEI